MKSLMTQPDDIQLSPMRDHHLDDVLRMWFSLLKLTEEVNYRYRLSSDAVALQRQFFEENRYNSNAFCFVAQHEGECIGFVNGYIMKPAEVFEQRLIGLIENIWVENEFRRQNVGKRLVDVCKRWFREKEIHDIYINVVPANETSVHFWNAMGFSQHKVTMARSV